MENCFDGVVRRSHEWFGKRSEDFRASASRYSSELSTSYTQADATRYELFRNLADIVAKPHDNYSVAKTPRLEPGRAPLSIPPSAVNQGTS